LDTSRTWQEIAQELSGETDSDRMHDLCEELKHALEEDELRRAMQKQQPIPWVPEDL
jgi:hypothetical protein